MPRYNACGLDVHLTTGEPFDSTTTDRPIHRLEERSVEDPDGMYLDFIGRDHRLPFLMSSVRCPSHDSRSEGSITNSALPLGIVVDAVSDWHSCALSRDFGHLKAEVFLNGELVATRMAIGRSLTVDDLRKPMLGRRVTATQERPFAFFPSQKSNDQQNSKELFATHWQEVNKQLRHETTLRGFDKWGNGPPSADYLEAVSGIDVNNTVLPSQAIFNSRIPALVDVVITHGHGYKYEPKVYHYLPSRMTDERYDHDSRQLKRRKIVSEVASQSLAHETGPSSTGTNERHDINDGDPLKSIQNPADHPTRHHEGEDMNPVADSTSRAILATPEQPNVQLGNPFVAQGPVFTPPNRHPVLHSPHNSSHRAACLQHNTPSKRSGIPFVVRFSPHKPVEQSYDDYMAKTSPSEREQHAVRFGIGPRKPDPNTIASPTKAVKHGREQMGTIYRLPVQPESETVSRLDAGFVGGDLQVDADSAAKAMTYSNTTPRPELVRRANSPQKSESLSAVHNMMQSETIRKVDNIQEKHTSTRMPSVQTNPIARTNDLHEPHPQGSAVSTMPQTRHPDFHKLPTVTQPRTPRKRRESEVHFQQRLPGRERSLSPSLVASTDVEMQGVTDLLAVRDVVQTPPSVQQAPQLMDTPTRPWYTAASSLSRFGISNPPKRQKISVAMPAEDIEGIGVVPAPTAVPRSLRRSTRKGRDPSRNDTSDAKVELADTVTRPRLGRSDANGADEKQALAGAGDDGDPMQVSDTEHPVFTSPASRRDPLARSAVDRWRKEGLDWPVPCLSRDTSVTYLDRDGQKMTARERPGTGKTSIVPGYLMPVKKERAGVFEEEGVVLGVRFVVF